MVSVEMLFRVQVLLDVIFQALFLIDIGDFYDTICKMKMKYILLYLIMLKRASIRGERKFNAGVVFDVAEVSVGYSCGVRVGYFRRVSVKRAAVTASWPRRGQFLLFFKRMLFKGYG